MRCSYRGFSRIVGVSHTAINKLLHKSHINPVDYYADRLEPLVKSGEMTVLESLKWHKFFAGKLPASAIVAPVSEERCAAKKKKKKRRRTPPVKEPINLTLTPEQTDFVISNVSARKRDTLFGQLSILRRAQEIGVLDAGATNVDLRRILDKYAINGHRLSIIQYKKVVKKIRNQGIQKFIEGHVLHGKGRKDATKIDEDDLDVFMNYYLNGAGHSVDECWAAMVGDRNPLDFARPSTFLFQTQKHNNRAQIAAARKGKEYASRMFGASVKRYSNALPCENWIGDAMLFDSLVIGSDGKQTRPWLTAWMDEKSKRFVGYVIHEGDQKVEHILLALQKGVSAYRAPKNIIIDNGKTYRAHAFSGGRPDPEKEDSFKTRMAACNVLGIKASFCIPHNHHGKDIERHFGIIHRGFDRFQPSYVGTGGDRHPDLYNKIQRTKNKEKYLPTIEEFRERFDKYLRETYDMRPFKGGENRGKNPISLWNAGYAQYAENNERISDSAAMLLCARTTVPKTIRGDGIYDARTNSYYWSEWMMAHNGEKVYLRIRPDDNSKAFCYDENDVYQCTAERIERIPKYIDFNEGREKLAEQMRRVKTANRHINKRVNLTVPDNTVAITDIENMGKLYKTLARNSGADTELIVVEDGNITLTKADHDLAAAAKQEKEGEARLPDVPSPVYKKKLYLTDADIDYEPLDYDAYKVG